VASVSLSDAKRVGVRPFGAALSRQFMPPGSSRFCSRQTWRGQVAYASQFADANTRAHIGKAKIKSRLIGDLDPNEWDLPPKPKWMRWSTYNRYLKRHDAYEAILDYGIAELMAKFLSK
jgi:hypothetical protein